MITLHILKLLEANGYGTAVLAGNETGDELLYFEKLPVGKTGVYIMSNGDPITRGARRSQSFDLYCRGKNDIDGSARLERIKDFFLSECYPSCDLPDVPGYSDYHYTKTTILPTADVQNIGQDETDRVIYVMSAQIIYEKEILTS